MILAFTNGCVKETDVKSIHLIETNTTNDLLKLASYNNITKIAGGNTWYSGEILSFENGIISNRFINDITFLNIRYDSINNHFVGIGLNGSYYEIEDSIANYTNSNYQVIRDIYFGDNYNIIVGGKSYAFGYVHKVGLDKSLQSKTEIPHEFRAIDKIGTKIFAVGFGIIASSIDDGISWQKTELIDDFFLSIVKASNEKAYIIGQENTIYSTSDYGKSWEKSKAPGKEQVNHARFLNNQLHLFCDGGIIKVQSKSEDAWVNYKISDLDINDGTLMENQLFVIGEKGFAALVSLN